MLSFNFHHYGAHFPSIFIVSRPPGWILAFFMDFVTPPTRYCYFRAFRASPDARNSTPRISGQHQGGASETQCFSRALKQMIFVDFLVEIRCETSTVPRFSSVLLLLHLLARLRRPENNPPESADSIRGEPQKRCVFSRALKQIIIVNFLVEIRLTRSTDLSKLYTKKSNSRSKAQSNISASIFDSA